MANINEILARAAALRDETALNSISPKRAGGIMYDTLMALNELWLQQGAALVISKIYASVDAMEADTAPVSDISGKPLRSGQIVIIASEDEDNGSVYRYNGPDSPSWSLVGKIGNLEPVDSLDSDSTQLPLAAHQGKVLDGKINQLGQKQINNAKSFLRLPQGGKIIASPTIWFHNAANCEVILKFKIPSAISSTSFLLSWQGGDGASYLYLDAQNILYCVWEGTRKTYFSIADYLGTDIELRLVRYGGAAGNLFYLYINGEQKYVFNADSVGYSGNLYIGSYINSYETNLVTDYNYLFIRNLDTQAVETFNADATFVELSADKYVCGEQLTSSSTRFEDFVNHKGIIRGNLTISSAVVLPANTHLRGDNCKVTIVGSNASITLQDGCSLEGFDFDGGASYTRQSKTDAHPEINPEYRYDLEPVVSVGDIARIGTSFGGKSLVILDSRNASVINCTFENFYGVYSCVKNISSDSSTYNGTKQNSIINCHFNDGFLAIENRSEFSRIIGCEFKNFAFGLYAYAGNLNLSACHFVRCDIGVVVANSGNGGHSQYSGCEWAHNGIYGLYAESLPTRMGLCISGSQFADAPIGGLLGGLCITGSRIDSWFSFQFASATGTCNMIHDCIFDLTTLSRDYHPSEYGVPGYLDYYFQLADGCSLDLKNNISLNPQYLPNTILNN